MKRMDQETLAINLRCLHAIDQKTVRDDGWMDGWNQRWWSVQYDLTVLNICYLILVALISYDHHLCTSLLTEIIERTRRWLQAVVNMRDY